MNTSIQNAIEVYGALAAIAGFIYTVRRWIKRIAVWLGKQMMRVIPDSSAVSLRIPTAQSVVELPVGTTEGVTKTMAKSIMFGADQLFAYTITRKEFPGTQYLVVRNRPDQQRQYEFTLNRDAANDQWNKWYQEWEQKGFGGASGTGLSGEPPFGS